MKTVRVVSAASLSVVVLVCAALSVRAEPEKVKVKDKNVAESPSQAFVMRADEIAKFKVKNAAGEDLGKVEDLVVDMSTGKVRYVAISFGGLLGVGDKLFAFPFESLKVRHNAGDNTRHLEANATKESLKNAPGFDKNSWPDFASPKWSTENDKYYQATRTTVSR